MSCSYNGIAYEGVSSRFTPKGNPIVHGVDDEVIADKVTGFLVNSVDEAVAAVGKIDSIDRKKCRQRVEENFTIDRMVAGYEKVYEEIFRRESQKK